MHQVYLLLGVNLGDRFLQMETALKEIELQIGRVIKSSSLYETAAWGVEDVPDYLNQVVLVDSSLEPLLVLKKIKKIEEKLGRTRNVKWESRLIDIDILYYDRLIMDTDKLTIPHPYLHFRKFTLVPLLEIDNDFLHPVLNKNHEELLLELNDHLEVKIVKPED